MSLCAICKRRYKSYSIIITNKVESLLFDKYIRYLYYQESENGKQDIGVCQTCRKTELIENNEFRWKATIFMQITLNEMIKNLDKDDENVIKYKEEAKRLKEEEQKYFNTPEIQKIVSVIKNENKPIKDKDYMVVIPEEIQNKIKDSGHEDEIENIISKLQKGDFSDAEEMDMVVCEIRLVCVECNSENMSWLLDKNSKEVYYKCPDCDDSGWMHEHEYEEAVKNNPDKVIKE